MSGVPNSSVFSSLREKRLYDIGSDEIRFVRAYICEECVKTSSGRCSMNDSIIPDQNEMLYLEVRLSSWIYSYCTRGLNCLDN